MSKQEIKIFVGSPEDVKEERKVVFDLIKKLNDQAGIREYFVLKAVAWDEDPYLSNTWVSPQKAIAEGLTRPSRCDFAIFIFWSRIGTPLAPEDFPDADLDMLDLTGTPLTGSTWELYDALADKGSTVHCETFRCERELPPSSIDLDQLSGIKALFAGFKQDGSYKRSYTTYKELDAFEDAIEAKLRLFLEPKKTRHQSSDQNSLQIEAGKPRVLRRKQLDWLAALLGKLQQRPQAKDCLDNCKGLAVPLVVSGQELEWHRALARQLKALLNNYDPEIAEPAILPGWHDNRDLELRKLHLVNEIRARLDLPKLSKHNINKDSDLQQDISLALRGKGAEVFHCVSIAERWADDDEEKLIRWWLAFWRSVTLPDNDQKICALLSIEVPKPAGFFKRITGKDTEAKVKSTLATLANEQEFAPFILENLSSPTRSCRREWCESQLAHVKNIDELREDLDRASDAVFEHQESIPHKLFKDALSKQLKPQN